MDDSVLDRLNKLSEPSTEREYTLDEQLKSASSEESINEMSFSATDTFQEVTLDDDDTDEISRISSIIDEVSSNSSQSIVEEPIVSIPHDTQQISSVNEQQTIIESSINTSQRVQPETITQEVQQEQVINNTAMAESDDDIDDDLDNDTEDDIDEELFINNNTSKRKTKQSRKKRDTNVNDTTEYVSNPIYDQLVQELIELMRKKKITLDRFDEQSMQLLFDYMSSKF